MKITLKQLKTLGACSEQFALFKATFGASVTLTEAIVMEHGGKFDLLWIARRIFSAPAWAEYEKVRAPAWAEYEKVRAPAWAEYEKVCAPAWAEYEKVRAPAWAEYEKVCAPAFWAAVQIEEREGK
jgi:hypothetical protein